ncbi:energy transducer TonB [Rhodohalobacter barkolensis]|uniref:Energy transducer TonB n=1 Tax=Rhodohalobacter barkolensis TaxID=2053187 RepID=A0A2N0VEA2_9BACT|nr:energy transducer TonB [Rhodohalobacter barkolensis]PKD42513.1 energy transducer TonB [Rhodohalobacter barkolensis]
MEAKNNKPGIEGKKKKELDLRNYYTILWETGLIVALLIFIILFRIDFVPTQEEENYVVETQEEVVVEEIVQTRQQPEIPPPPRPPVPVEVPNDEIIEDINIEIDSELDIFSESKLPPPPPPSAEEEKDEEEEEDFFVFVEEMPKLKGDLMELQSKVRYPELARKAGIEGRVHIQFVVNEMGEVEDPRVIRGIGGGCDEEALRVIRQAEFTPGLQRGKPVRVQFSLPVYFKIKE